MNEKCFEGALRFFQETFKSISRKFRGCFKEV